jgi:toxin-antitoxin system PIN domain toxin
MPSSSFPDVNVWLALLLDDHVHRAAARRWWEADHSELIAFTRFTQFAVLRLLSTAAAMNGKPLTLRAAWAAYDELFADERVALVAEPPGAEATFRRYTAKPVCSPKLWADAWLVAVAEQHGGQLITFDRALASRSEHCLLLR